MSDHIPFHIQEEIMKRLPVKSLVQFRCVSKAWKSLIDSSQFIAAHSLHRHTQQQHLLVIYEDLKYKKNYVSYIDEDTFPQQMSVLTPPLSVNQFNIYLIAGSSHGLFCLYKPTNNLKPGMVILWNPSIRKSIVVDIPGGGIIPSVGFGVCPVTSDPKIVVVTQSWDISDIEASYQCEVMVYTLSSGKWRSLSDNLPTKPFQDFRCTMVTDQFIYWSTQTRDVIISFDVTNENFEMIALPNSLAYRCVYFSKLLDSFVITEYDEGSIEHIGTVCMLEHRVQKVFIKLFSVKMPHDYIRGFTKSGIPIVKVTDGDPDDSDDDDDEPSKLVVCQPNSEHNNVLHISPCHFTVNSYMETLLLLNRSDCISY